jgi:hypothetical protein
LQEYSELASKLHEFHEREQLIRERLQESEAILANGSSSSLLHHVGHHHHASSHQSTTPVTATAAPAMTMSQAQLQSAHLPAPGLPASSSSPALLPPESPRPRGMHGPVSWLACLRVPVLFTVGVCKDRSICLFIRVSSRTKGMQGQVSWLVCLFTSASVVYSRTRGMQ